MLHWCNHIKVFDECHFLTSGGPMLSAAVEQGVFLDIYIYSTETITNINLARISYTVIVEIVDGHHDELCYFIRMIQNFELLSMEILQDTIRFSVMSFTIIYAQRIYPGERCRKRDTLACLCC